MSRPAVWFFWLAGCTASPDPAGSRVPAAVDSGLGGEDSAAETPVDTGGDTDTLPPAELYCPDDMAAVTDSLDEIVYCIDKYEVVVDAAAESALGARDQGADYPDGSTSAVAVSAAGEVPTIVISWYQAVAVCLNAEKYLCSSDEWRDACDGTVGDGGDRYPWGSSWSDDACVTLTQGDVRQYDALQPTGSLATCVSPFGAYDMVGNAWEWADPLDTDADGLPITDKRGGAYYAGQGSSQCDSPFDDHPPDFTGTIVARCCMTPLVR